MKDHSYYMELALEEAWRAYAKGEVPIGAVLEPCVMCSGAIVQARVENVIYGASDPKYGCCGSCIDLVGENKFNHQAKIISGVLEEECSMLMKNFFKELRERKKK